MLRESLVDAWQPLVAWLREQAPRSAADLAPPLRAEDAAAFTLPPVAEPVIHAWLSLHDGQTGDADGIVKPGWRLLCRREIRDWHQMLVAGSRTYAADLLEEAMQNPRAGRVVGVFLPLHVPVLGRDNGTFMFVDLAPGDDHGCVREWAREDGDGPATWSGLDQMLSDTLTDARAGVGSSVVDGELRWDW